jgi:hypothetical protein
MKHRLLVLALGIAVASASGCMHRTPEQVAADTPQPAFVRVDNQAFLDANIYVISGGQRQRLGTTTGVGSHTFQIPRGVIFGPSQLSFLVDFIGSSRTPISDVISVSPGDTVILTIPPQ